MSWFVLLLLTLTSILLRLVTLRHKKPTSRDLNLLVDFLLDFIKLACNNKIKIIYIRRCKICKKQ